MRVIFKWEFSFSGQSAGLLVGGDGGVGANRMAVVAITQRVIPWWVTGAPQSLWLVGRAASMTNRLRKRNQSDTNFIGSTHPRLEQAAADDCGTGCQTL